MSTRNLLRRTVTLGTTLILVATLWLGISTWRRAEDAKWCRKATTSSALPGDAQPATPDLLEHQRSACAVQRQRQRVMLGAVWRKGGQETAKCGFELARVQLLSDHDLNSRNLILKRYGIDDSDFEASSRNDQERFVEACLANGRHEAR